MTTKEAQTLTKVQKTQIYGFARTLYETADEIQQLCRAKKGERSTALWLINQTHKKIHTIVDSFGENF